MDLFASQYGWTVEYILALPMDQVRQLEWAMMRRMGMHPVRKRLGDCETAPHDPLGDKIRSILDSHAF